MRLDWGRGDYWRGDTGYKLSQAMLLVLGAHYMTEHLEVTCMLCYVICCLNKCVYFDLNNPLLGNCNYNACFSLRMLDR